MTKTFIGGEGRIMGGARYFERRNKEHFIGSLMRNRNGSEYYDGLRETEAQILQKGNQKAPKHQTDC